MIFTIRPPIVLKKISVGQLLLLAIEGVEALYNKVKQRPRLSMSVLLIPPRCT